MGHIAYRHSASGSFMFRLPGETDFMDCDRPREICMHARYFTVGLSLPFLPEVEDFLRYFRMVTFQLHPNPCRVFLAYLVICRHTGKDASLPIFSSFYTLYHSASMIFSFYQATKENLIGELAGANVDHKWEDRYVFIRRADGAALNVSLKWYTFASSSELPRAAR